MNPESIIKQFEIVENSLHRARLPFDTNMLDKRVVEVSLYELMKSREQIENMIREIDPERFGPTHHQVLHIPELSIQRLFICPYCGNPDCQSDHK